MWRHFLPIFNFKLESQKTERFVKNVNGNSDDSYHLRSLVSASNLLTSTVSLQTISRLRKTDQTVKTCAVLLLQAAELGKPNTFLSKSTWSVGVRTGRLERPLIPPVFTTTRSIKEKQNTMRKRLDGWMSESAETKRKHEAAVNPALADDQPCTTLAPITRQHERYAPITG